MRQTLANFLLPCLCFPSQITLRFPSEKIYFPSLGIGYLVDLGHRPGEFFPFIFWDGHFTAKDLIEILEPSLLESRILSGEPLPDCVTAAIEHFQECKKFNKLPWGEASGEPLVSPFPSLGVYKPIC